MPSDIQFDQSAFGDSYATASAGPGGVALLTGDYSISAVDASVTSYLGGMSVGRSLTTLAPADAGVSPAAQRSDTSGVFGPGWTAELAGPAAGDAQLTITDTLNQSSGPPSANPTGPFRASPAAPGRRWDQSGLAVAPAAARFEAGTP